MNLRPFDRIPRESNLNFNQTAWWETRGHWKHVWWTCRSCYTLTCGFTWPRVCVERGRVSREALIECFVREVVGSKGDRKCLVGPICMCALMVRGPVCRALKWNEILSLLCLSSGLWLNRSSDKRPSEAITHRRRFHTWQLDSGRPLWLVVTPVSRHTPTFPLCSSDSNILSLQTP